MEKWTDPSWIFGFCLLAVLAGMGFAFGLGKVDEAHSYGLREVIAILGVVAGGWSGYKLHGSDNNKKEG